MMGFLRDFMCVLPTTSSLV